MYDQPERWAWRTGNAAGEAHRLWSLWHMYEFHAGEFYGATARLAEVSSYLSAMKGNEDSVFQEDHKPDSEDTSFITQRIKALTKHLGILGANITYQATTEAETAINRYVTWGDAR